MIQIIIIILNENETFRQIYKEREKEELQKKKKEADSRFIWEASPKDQKLFEFSENPVITQDMPHNTYPFDFQKLFLIR